MILKILRLFSIVSILFLTGFFFLNCTKTTKSQSALVPSSGTVPNPDFSKLKPSCYVANTDSVINYGSFEPNLAWNDPHVLWIDSNFVMYASAGVFATGEVGIYRLISSDGINWRLSPSSPVLTKADSSVVWDGKAVETPSVVFFAGKYHMFYTGYTDKDDLSTFKVGHATSDDGIVWTKDLSPLIEPTWTSLAFDEYVVSEPGAVVFNNKLYVYFAAIGANLSVNTVLQTIGYISSTDGINWTSPAQTILPDQTLYPRGDSWYGYSTPQPIVMNGQVHMYLDVINENPSWSQQKIHHLYSSDGETGWTHDGSEIFDRSKFSWTAHEIRSPSPLLVQNVLYLWFAGSNTNNVNSSDFKMGIGFSSCQL
jgi:predicted GH43/DUF377 family glycosyl hydrolase